ncbi:MAG: hypothetical protein Q8Q10_03430 [bacterium]|nr:hypothetical protein [bacterium]
MPFIVIILFGALASSFALILELLAVSLFPLSGQAIFTSLPFALRGALSFEILLILICIAFIEEASKYIFLRQYARRFFANTAVAIRNSLLLGALFGLGFTFLEIFFLLNTPAAHPFSTLLGTASVHIATSITFALFLFSSPSPSLLWPKRHPFSAFSLISAAVLFHTLYNLAILLFS